MFDHDFYTYIDSLQIPYKEKKGDIWLHHCPFCEPNGKTKEPYGNFSFTSDGRGFYCNRRNHCNPGQGSMYYFKLQRGDIISGPKKKVYKIPPPKPELTNNTEKFYRWYEKERGISIDVLKKYQVGYEKKSKVTFVYQYFNEKKQLRNRQYKYLDKSRIWMEKNAEPIYYGLQFINYESDTLYIVEGLDDVHAFNMYTGEYCVGMPNGTNCYSKQMDEVNNQFEKLVLIFDNDNDSENNVNAGQVAARKFAEKAGLHKCCNVVLPYKDLRDCVKYKVPKEKIIDLIDNAVKFKDDRISKVDSYEAEFFEYINSTKSIGFLTQYSDFNRITGGIRTGELTVITGNTGVGKTTLAYNVGMWCVKEMPFLAMSFENDMGEIIKKLVEIISWATVKRYDEENNKWVHLMTPSDKLKFFKLLCENELYFLNKANSDRGYFDEKIIFDVIEYACKFYNIKQVLIDHLHYFLNLSKYRNPYMKQAEVIRKFSWFAKQLDIHIMLIAHPKKIEADKNGVVRPPSINDGKGDSSLHQESNNFWVVSCRNSEFEGEDVYESKLTIEKNRGHGKQRNNSCIFKVKDNKNTYYM